MNSLIANPRPSAVLLAVVLWTAGSLTWAQVTPHPLFCEGMVLENEVLAVQFDPAAQTFSILHKPSKRTFIRDGRFRHDGGTATVGDIAYPVLGRGRAITVDIPTAEVVRMAVYPGLPFVVFDSTLRNPSKDPIDTHALALFTAELVTGAGISVIVSGPATEPLGGLNKTYQTFAALLPFMQQHGAVAGWVTHNRGSGVIVTSAADKRATIMPRLVERSVTDEKWDTVTKTLSGVNAVVANDPCELRIVMPTDGTWTAGEVTVSDEDVKAGVTKKVAADGENLRVTLNSPASRQVRWSVACIHR